MSHGAKPNVVFILVDDMGIGDLSSVNGGLSHTPTLDGLVAEGTSLAQHYAASTVCNPSRATLLTVESLRTPGRLQCRHPRGRLEAGTAVA